MIKTKEIISEAVSLPIDIRTLLVNELLESLNPTIKEIDELFLSPVGKWGDNNRDIGHEILDGLKTIKQGQGKCTAVKFPNVLAIREWMKLSQSAFAAMLGVSSRTLQDWEQGRRKPSDPALSLLRVAAIRPDAIREAITA